MDTKIWSEVKNWLDEQHAAKVIAGGALGAVAGNGLSRLAKGKNKKGEGHGRGTAVGALIGALAAHSDNNRENAKYPFVVAENAAREANEKMKNFWGNLIDQDKLKSLEKSSSDNGFPQFVIEKDAAAGDVLQSLNNWLTKAKDWYSKQDAGTKALIGTGGGALVGGALGGLFGGKGGLATGAVLGGLGGAAGTIDWNKLLGNKPADLTPEQLKAIRDAGRRSVKK